jgi:hypothetical protein
MTENDHNFPATVTEAVNRLLSDLPLDTKHQIFNSSEEGLINFHFGLGMAIRNDYGLWKEDSKLLDDCKKISGNPSIQVDDASGRIIKALWKRLQEYPPPKVFRDTGQFGYFSEK